MTPFYVWQTEHSHSIFCLVEESKQNVAVPSVVWLKSLTKHFVEHIVGSQGRARLVLMRSLVEKFQVSSAHHRTCRRAHAHRRPRPSFALVPTTALAHHRASRRTHLPSMLAHCTHPLLRTSSLLARHRPPPFALARHHTHLPSC
jgi:hypothetical protein